MAELLGLFGASFAAATLFPLPSEAALFAYLQAHPEDRVLAVAVATVGNTAGGMTTYGLARLIPRSRKINERSLDAIKRYGAPLTFFAWLPIIGDALCAAAGWLRIRWWAALAFMATGRLARYIVVAALS
ncbi:MAG TPA: YqaA family protein [Burkholderiales bacterium]|nr:YqaA family protein [Burkholderiales bacterium]